MRIFNEILGEHVEIPERVERIVSLSPGITETLYMLGAGSLVVGTDAFSNKPPEARVKAKVGSYTHVNMDLLMSLKPDLVLVMTGVQRALVDRIRSEGLRVYPLPLPADVAGIVSNISLTGYVTNRVREARELVSKIYRLLGELSKPRSGRDKNVLVVLDFGPRGGLWSPGAASHIGDAIDIVGGLNVAGFERVSYVEVGRVLRGVDRIDILIYENSSYITGDRPAGYEALRSMISSAGIRIGREVVLNEERFAHTGPSFITEAMAFLKELLDS